jgi:hypothetical protein
MISVNPTTEGHNMPRNTKKTVRTLKEIFEQSEKFGADNVMLNDAETGAVWTGGAKPLDSATIANKRYRGDFNVPVTVFNGGCLERLSPS